MQSLQDVLVNWATIIGAVVGLVGLIQSRTWLSAFGTVCLGVSVFLGIYARQERRLVNSAGVKIAGQSIDSLNIANLRRRTNKSLIIQEVHHHAVIDGSDLTMTWRYSGYCSVERESAMEFSIDSDRSVPFAQLDCFGYDVTHDPAMKHKLRPFLIGTDGISKKIGVPFLAPLAAQQPFSILLKCTLRGCLNSGLDYYTSTLSFAQQRVPTTRVTLQFLKAQPAWVRVYDCSGSANPRLIKELAPVKTASQLFDYADHAKDLDGNSATTYMFMRA